MNENDLSDGNWFFYGTTTDDRSHLHSINEHFNQRREHLSLSISFSEYNVVILEKKKKYCNLTEFNLLTRHISDASFEK